MTSRFPAQFIDAHTHFFPPKLFRAIWRWFDANGWPIHYRLSPDGAAGQLMALGAARFTALNYAHRPGMAASLNAWTHALAQRYPQIIPFGTFHQDDEDPVAEVERCLTEYGFHGLKYHCHVQGSAPDDPRLFPVLEKLVEHDGVLIIHAGRGPNLPGYNYDIADICGAVRFRRMVARFPGLRCVIPHLGAPEFEAFFDIMEEFPTVYTDTTMMLSGFFPYDVPRQRLAALSDRVMYGSDFPNIPYDVSAEFNGVLDLQLGADVERRIFYENAVRFFRLPA